MRRILLGWEIGEHRGHVVQMQNIAARLRGQNLQIVWAVLRVDQLKGIAADGEPIFQSPVWPGLHLESALSRPVTRHFSHADILADLGLRLSGAFYHLLAAWDGILAAARPDAVFADFAPALLNACRGRIPTVTAGIGFALPPSHTKVFPRFPLAKFAGIEIADKEPALLNEVNTGLARQGRPVLSRLPEMFGADVRVISSFKELDPFAEYRTEDQAPPSLMNWAPPAAKAGDEIIVYWSERLMKLTAIFEQLTATGLPVRVVAPGLRPEHAAKFPRLIFESKPLHFSEIARRARLVISNAPAGFVSAAMLAGLPQAVLPYDVQKELVGQAIESLGVGVSDSLARVDWKAWRQKIEMLYADVGTRGRAVTWASKLAPRMHRPPAEICAEALAQLV